MGICNILLVVVALQWTRMIPPGDDWGEGGGRRGVHVAMLAFASCNCDKLWL